MSEYENNLSPNSSIIMYVRGTTWLFGLWFNRCIPDWGIYDLRDIKNRLMNKIKLPKDFGRIKMEEEMLRQNAKRRMKEWQKENETSIWDVVMIVAVCSLLAYLIIRSIL